MEEGSEPRVIFSDRIDGGIVVGFDDGKTVFYSAALLLATLPLAQMLPSDSETDYSPESG
jgi:hypothetical protein